MGVLCRYFRSPPRQHETCWWHCRPHVHHLNVLGGRGGLRKVLGYNAANMLAPGEPSNRWCTEYNSEYRVGFGTPVGQNGPCGVQGKHVHQLELYLTIAFNIYVEIVGFCVSAGATMIATHKLISLFVSWCGDTHQISHQTTENKQNARTLGKYVARDEP